MSCCVYSLSTVLYCCNIHSVTYVRGYAGNIMIYYVLTSRFLLNLNSVTQVDVEDYCVYVAYTVEFETSMFD